jgi:pimeloyl-ACP methyl ester carboxylesterase
MNEMDRRNGTGSWTGGLGSMRALGSELSALVRVVGALPWRSLADDTLEDGNGDAVPVVFVHGVIGDPTNFTTLRRHLARYGIRRFSSFAYRPRLDYQRLAPAFGEHLAAVRASTGADQVDVVAHSLGGLIARYAIQTGGASDVRRLVTLGTPYLADENPRQELAVFATGDVLVPPPSDRAYRRALVLDGCGHLGLLSDARALKAVTRHLRRPALGVQRRLTLVA